MLNIKWKQLRHQYIRQSTAVNALLWINYVHQIQAGLVRRLVSISFFHLLLYYRFAIVLEKGYAEFEDVLSTVTTKVEGLDYTDGAGIYENVGNRVWDSSDYVIPPQVWSQITWCQQAFMYSIIFSHPTVYLLWQTCGLLIRLKAIVVM